MLIISSATVAALVGQDCCCCVINNILIGKLMKGNVQTFLARRTLRLLRIPYLYDWCNMDNFINMLNAKVLPVANKVGTQRHMTAIRKGIISTLPLTIVGSFFTILNNMPIEAVANFLAPYAEILDVPFRYTVGILALYATFGIASSLAESYQLDKLTNGVLAVLAFLVSTAVPVHVTKNVSGVISSGRYINIANLSASSLFGSIITGLLTVEIFRYGRL